MEATGFILSLQPVLNNISATLISFKHLPGAFAELGKVVNTFEELLTSFERENGGQGNFPWIQPLKDSLEGALKAIQTYKKQPIKCKIFSSLYLEKIENARRHINDAVNATAISNAHLALQARNTLNTLAEKIEDLNEQNEKFQKDLKIALSENKTETLEHMAKMNGMDNEYDLRQQLIDAEQEKKDVKDLMFDTEQKLAIKFSKLAITKMEEYPHEYKCPITLDIMENPYVLFQSGYTYEYEAIMMALAKKPGIDPYTNQKFDGPPFLKENHTLRSAIQGWKDSQRRKIYRMQSVRGGRNLLCAAPSQPSQFDPLIDPQSALVQTNNNSPYATIFQSLPQPPAQPPAQQSPQSPPHSSLQLALQSIFQSVPQSISQSIPQSVSQSVPQSSSQLVPKSTSQSSTQLVLGSVSQLSLQSSPSACLQIDSKYSQKFRKMWKKNRSYIIIFGIIINVILLSVICVIFSKQSELEQLLEVKQPVPPSARPTPNLSLDSLTRPSGGTSNKIDPSFKSSVSLEQFRYPTLSPSPNLKSNIIIKKKRTMNPTSKSSLSPSNEPTVIISSKPSTTPSIQPIINPSCNPSPSPSTQPILKLKKKLTQVDGTGDDRFGSSVSVSGDIVVIGAYHGSHNGINSGSAHIFTKSGDYVAKLTAPDGVVDDNFGNSVSVSGDIIVVGARGDDDKGPDSGSAHIFNTSGEYIAKIIAPDGAADDYFGQSVSVSGNIIVVGNSYDGNNGGFVHIFNTSGEFVGKLIAGAAGDQFGKAVSVSGNIIVVGARSTHDNGYKSGSAYIFTTSGEFVDKLMAPDGAAGDRFGSSVSVSGDIIVVGSWFDDDKGSNSGSAYIFSTSGKYIAKITAPDGAADDRFGSSVSVSGNIIVVGAWGDQVHGYRSGSAYIYTTSGEYISKFTAPDGASYDHFGWSVSMSENTVVVGAWYDEVFGFNSGSAYIFSLSV